MNAYQPTDPAEAGQPHTTFRRAALTVIAVAVALLVFAGGVAASRLFVHDSGTSTVGAPGPSDAGSAPAGTAPPGSAPAGTATGEAATTPAGTVTPAAAPGGGGGGGAPRCHTAGLRLQYGPGGAAAGSEYHALAFTNISGHTCRMYGFPGMAPIDAHGTWITDVRTMRESQTPRLVTLAPGATAWADIHWARVDGTYHGAACSPGAAGLVVTPPDETTQLTLRSPIMVCGYGEIWTGPITTQRPSSG